MERREDQRKKVEIEEGERPSRQQFPTEKEEEWL